MNSGAGIKRLILFLGLVLGGGTFITWQLVLATTDTAEQLVVWGLWQDSSQLESIIADYQEQSGTAVKYKKIASVMTYQPELIEALAAGRGPDLFVIHHTWVDSMIDHLAPAPAEVMTAKEVASQFAPVVTTDLVRADQVYALPTSIDSLALFYNQAALASAGLKPPATWTDFLQATIRLTSTDQAGALLQSGAALGTASNVNRAPDIVQLLLLQSGLDIITEDGSSDIDSEAGQRALNFYTAFANPGKEIYTWNSTQEDSLQAFATGATSLMINYAYHLPTIRALNPKLPLATAPLPQISGTAEMDHINFAAYWPFAVAAKSPHQAAAWDFLQFLTSQKQADALNQRQKLPPARNDNKVDLTNDPLLKPFVDQVPTAISWPRFDLSTSDNIFSDLINNAGTAQPSVSEALGKAAGQLSLSRAP